MAACQLPNARQLHAVMSHQSQISVTSRLGRGRPDRAELQHQLPALRFWQKTECGHTLTRVAAADFPEQGAIALRLNLTLRQVRGLRAASTVIAVTGGAALMKQFRA